MTWTDSAFFFIILILVLALCLIFHFIVVRNFGALEGRLYAAVNDFVDSFVLKTENEIEKDMKAILALVQEAIEPNITVDLHRVRRQLWEAYIEISLTDVVTSESSNTKEICTKVLRSISKVINKHLIKEDYAKAVREIDGIVAKFDYEMQHVSRVPRQDFSFADIFNSPVEEYLRYIKTFGQSSAETSESPNNELNNLLERFVTSPYTIYKTKGELRRTVVKATPLVKNLIQKERTKDLRKLRKRMTKISQSIVQLFGNNFVGHVGYATFNRFNSSFLFLLAIDSVMERFLSSGNKEKALAGIDLIALHFTELTGVPSWVLINVQNE
ncbi:uncharacterized protein LOC144745974 [Ciona intestinalis]